MFCLQESELIEDNIKDSNVLKLYKALRKHESCSDRQTLIETILTNDSCIGLTELILKYHKSPDISIDEINAEEQKFSSEQREAILQTLNLTRDDVASLALVVSATLTQLFVIDNFTGPTSDELLSKAYDNLPNCFQNLQQRLDYRSLSRDGSEVYHQVRNPWLLKLVQLYWLLLTSLGCSRRLLELEFLVWKHRYLTVHLMILLEPAESLVNELRKVQEFIFDHHIVKDQGTSTQLTRFNVTELCCELVQSSLLRDGITFCRKFYEFATEESGLAIEHTGVLGKRTKFQQNDIPQLVVKVTKKDDGNNKKATIKTEDVKLLPQDVKLEDDTLLPDISFVTNDENGQPVDSDQPLDIDAQLLMLTNLDIIFKSEVMEESLKDEWTLAYLRSIINSATIWAVKYKALALRSMVEKKHMRKMDRALRQMEELIKESEITDHSVNVRMQSFYSVLPSSSWQLNRSLGDISMDLNLFKNALEVYTRIEYWEGIIKCYCALGQTVKAEKIIRQELEKKETPYLYCLLGDVTEDIQFYEKSWTLSKSRFARAKKSIGTYYYVRKDYEKAIENYELALSVNPSNVSILSLLAYSCLTIERYERAAECYRNLTYYDDGSFLAWNNLSKAYIKLNQKERAWRTLREAIKCNYEEWKIWENFMTVSIEIGALDDVMTAWHRIIDIKSSHKDDQVLSALTYALITKPESKVDAHFVQLLSDALKLVARLNATSDCSPKLWISYSKLLIKEHEVANMSSNLKIESGPKSTKLDIDSRMSKLTNALQRATPTAVTTDSEWLQVTEKINQVLDSYDELMNCYRWALEIVGPRPEIWRQWKYFKMSIGNVMKLLNNRGYKAGS